MDRTLTTRKARTDEGGAGKAAGSLLFVPGLHQVGKKFVLLLSLPLNTGFLSTQSENDEKIPLTEYRESSWDGFVYNLHFSEPRASREGT